VKNTSGLSRSVRWPGEVDRLFDSSGKASLTLKDRTPDSGDQIVWKWVKGPVTPKADYGDPLTSDEFALCIYDVGLLLTSASAPAGGVCSGKPCWTDKPTNLTYRNCIGRRAARSRWRFEAEWPRRR
jgi:hypothetical protein